jgi:cobaltochelatase CobS
VGSLERIVSDIATNTVATYLAEHHVSISVDDVRDQLIQIVREAIPQPVVVQLPGREPKQIDGLTHKIFQELLLRVSARRNLILTGEMGVGKTHVTQQVAEALGLQCVVIPADVLPQRAEFIGGISPITREVIKGKARDCYEHGGVVVIDELDRGHASLSTALNHLLAGSSFDFDKDGGGTVNVKKHPDFMVLATTNTYGTGTSLRYVGASKLDQAGLDRFTFVHVDADEDMTANILKQTDIDTALKVLPIWLQARRNVERYGLDVCVSPRVAFDIQEYMRVGLSLERSCAGRLHGRGLNADLESKLLEGISF